ncbi:LysE family translocator [Achromobacter xylosoxidans]|uniref:LysE family translocator n=2 Tax=Alcaligenes xylosoxydans xylosoxydans TaxID=85698 RepID=A0A0X8NVN3_ALCXX|nr:LysE family translocator [Achromobacter xylosoxidans]
MFPMEVLITYLFACGIIVISPGPDNILALSRGLSQGSVAAAVSSLGAAGGIMVHTVAATFGLSLLMQTSEMLFWTIKLAGAAYLIYLGVKALRAKDLVTIRRADHLPLRKVLTVGFFSNVLNPKPGLFVLAFLPQFADSARGSVQVQMLVYGGIFAALTFVVFSIVGAFAARLSGWLVSRPVVAARLNAGAGLTLIGAGILVLTLRSGSSRG